MGTAEDTPMSSTITGRLIRLGVIAVIGLAAGFVGVYGSGPGPLLIAVLVAAGVLAAALRAGFLGLGVGLVSVMVVPTVTYTSLILWLRVLVTALVIAVPFAVGYGLGYLAVAVMRWLRKRSSAASGTT
jgi:hypothetical protein